MNKMMHHNDKNILKANRPGQYEELGCCCNGKECVTGYPSTCKKDQSFFNMMDCPVQSIANRRPGQYEELGCCCNGKECVTGYPSTCKKDQSFFNMMDCPNN